MADLILKSATMISAVPVAASTASTSIPPRRPVTPARREVVRAFRDRVASGTYEPPVDALSAQLAAWLLCDGLPDLEGA